MSENESASVSPAVIGWSIVAFAFSILFLFLPLPQVLGIGFFTKCFVVIAGTIAGTIGGLVGGFIGGLFDDSMGLKKIIGGFIGTFVGAAFVTSLILGIR